MKEESGSIFDKIGLGNIAPDVKSGLDSLDSQAKEALITEAIGLIVNSNGNYLSASSKMPTLGGFQDSMGKDMSLTSKRMGELKNNLSKLFKALSSDNNDIDIQRFQKTSILFNMIKGLFDNFSHFTNRASASNYSRLKL